MYVNFQFQSNTLAMLSDNLYEHNERINQNLLILNNKLIEHLTIIQKNDKNKNKNNYYNELWITID